MKKEHADIITSSLEDVMHESFLPYAEYVLLERALPRVEDGLKPVQRRILYAMNEMNLGPSSKHKKSARIVGETMGKFHPHGDTSIYEALARMAQDFSLSVPLIDGQGNFGSIDGDSPAAMRYTEARLTAPAMEMLRDIEKDTVPFQLNFNDELYEPILLPSRFPNLLVNGTSGIAVGLATNIPPHNLSETIDGVIFRIKNPHCKLSEIMKYIKAPDFPTGGILMDLEGLAEAYETGRGKITLRAKTQIEKGKNGKTLIVITELPYEVRESAMLRKIQTLRETKKDMFGGIDDIRSETDRTGIRAVIELKKDTDPMKMLDCLYKFSDLQITYGINMVVIADGQPKQLGLLSILDYYVAFQRKVVTRRTRYDIEQAEEKEHKLAGLIIAVENIDLVIKLIRSSETTYIAKQKLMQRLDLTGVQAQAILDLRLARLTQLEIDELRNEYARLLELLEYLRSVLASKEKLDNVIIDEIKRIKSKFGYKRKTVISAEDAKIVINENDFKTTENCFVIYTKSHGIKRMSPKAYTLGSQTEVTHNNLPSQIIETDTAQKIVLYTNLSNLYTLPVENIKEAKFKEPGSPMPTVLAGFEKNERVLLMQLYNTKSKLLSVSRLGYVKITDTENLISKKSKISAGKLHDGDRLIFIEPLSGEAKSLIIVTKYGMAIRFDIDEVSEQGKTGSGTSGIKLADKDEVVFASMVQSEGELVIFTDKGWTKRISLSDIDVQGRNGKGSIVLKKSKTANNGNIMNAFLINRPSAFYVTMKKGETKVLLNSDIPKEQRTSEATQLIFLEEDDSIAHISIE